MAKTEKKASTSTPRFRVGDWVEFDHVFYVVHGLIVEDRGRLGGGGRRLWGVKFLLDPSLEPTYTELLEEKMRPVDRHSTNLPVYDGIPYKITPHPENWYDAWRVQSAEAKPDGNR